MRKALLSKCWEKRARVLLLSQILEFVRVLDTLKHAFADFEWSASRRKARTRDLFCQPGDSHSRRQQLTIIIYALVRYVFGNLKHHVKIPCLIHAFFKHAFFNRFHPQRSLHCYPIPTFCQWTAALWKYRAFWRRGRRDSHHNRGEQQYIQLHH